jgi:addiction module RelE/StbE family toxin
VAGSQRKRVLEWSRRSARDLLKIEEFIARDDASAAEDVISEIINKALLLESHPTLGKRSSSGHRELVLIRFPFTIVYRLRRNAVVVSRVLHQRQQFPK